MDPSSILRQIRESKPAISVIGEDLLDRWHFGNFTRPTQEDPRVKVFACDPTNTLFQPGGAAAVHHSLSQILPGSVRRSESQRQSFKDRYVDVAENRLVFRGDTDMAHSEHPWIPAEDPIYSPNAVVSDYGKGMFNWQNLGEFAKKYEGNVIFSPHLSNCDLASRESVVPLIEWTWVVNQHEYQALRAQGAADRLPHIIVTRGQKDVLVHDQSGAFRASVVPRLKPGHTVGIGDVFLAAFSAACFSRVDLKKAVKFAVWICGESLASGRLGTCYVLCFDLNEAVSRL